MRGGGAGGQQSASDNEDALEILTGTEIRILGFDRIKDLHYLMTKWCSAILHCCWLPNKEQWLNNGRRLRRILQLYIPPYGWLSIRQPPHDTHLINHPTKCHQSSHPFGITSPFAVSSTYHSPPRSLFVTPSTAFRKKKLPPFGTHKS